MHNPLEQFKVYDIGSPITVGNVNLSFNNSALFVLLSALLVIITFLITLKKNSIIPTKKQIIAEFCYDFVYNMSVEHMGEFGKKMFPFMFTLFLLFLFGNLLGLIPLGFAFNSHLIITGTMGIIVLIIGVTYGLIKHKLRFFLIFYPPDVPVYLAPLIIPTEIISFFSKIFSMSVRIFANIMAGHLVLFVIASFVFSLGIFGIIPIGVVTLLTGFEIFIAVLHAYIFTVLSCVFIGEIVNLH
ncbi:F0F1 ATP synthase subunit A [Rickettsiales bacterium LUAb2]